MMRTREPANLTSLTALRGVAALFVVLFHFSGSFLPALNLNTSTDFVAKCYLWVDFFFILSGFILMHVYGTRFRHGFDRGRVRTYLAARVARIYPLYIVMLLAFVLLELARMTLWDGGLIDLHQLPFHGTRSIPALALNALMLQTTGLLDKLTWDGPAWSVGAEWYAYLLFPVLALLLHRLNWVLRVALVVATAGGLVLLDRTGSLDVTYNYGLLRCLLEFTLGAIAYVVYERRLLERLIGCDTVVALAIGAIVALMSLDAPDIYVPPLMALMVLGLALNRRFVNRIATVRPLVFLGEISYAIYLSHMFVLHLANLLARTMTGRRLGVGLDGAQSVLALVLLMALVIALAALLHRHVELPARSSLRARLAPAAA